MRPKQALRLSIEQRLGFEIAFVREVISQGYAQVQREIHDSAKVSESSIIRVHEAEQVLAALERVSGAFYRRIIDDAKAYREEQKRQAEEATDNALAAISAQTK